MCFQKSNHVLGKKWCSVASSTTYRRKMSAKEMMWKQQDIYILHYCPLYLTCIQSRTLHRTMTYYRTTCLYIYLLHHNDIFDYKSFWQVLKTTNACCFKTMSLYVHVHCMKVKLQWSFKAKGNTWHIDTFVYIA